MRLTANELHRRGVDATNHRRFGAARRALTAAAARTDDPDLSARIAGTRAYVLAQTGESAEAERICRDALARQGLRTETVAVLCGQLGALLTHSGRVEEAEAMLSRAADGLEPGGVELANCLITRSVVRMQRHDLAACIDDLERAVAIYEAHGEEEPLAEARHNLGYAALLGGDLVTALALMIASRPVLAATSDLAAAISDQDRAEVLRDAGLTTEAEQLLGRVATLFGAQRMPQARAEAEFHLARSLLHHDPAAAEQVARTATRRFRAQGSEGWAARSEAIHLEAALRAHPHAPPPAEEFALAADALDRGGFRTEATALRLTALLADHGDARGTLIPSSRMPRLTGDARGTLIPSSRMPRLTGDAPTPLRLRAQEVRAVLAARQGKDAAARRHAAAGLDLLADWQQAFGALDLQTSLAMHGTDLMLTGLAAAARSGDPVLLFDWSERARHLSQRSAPVRPPHDPALTEDLAELRMLRADLAGSDWTTDRRVRELRDRVRERQWSSTAASGIRDRVTLAQAQRALPSGTAAMCFVFTGSELCCVVVTADRSTVVRLSWSRVRAVLDGLRADLEVAARVRTGPLAAVVRAALDDRLARLDAELLAPALAETGFDARTAARLVVTVPGVLTGIPWSMLPTLRGIPLALAPSISRWVHAGPADRPRTAGFVAGPRVPRAGDEVRSAASAWPDSAVITQERATVDAVTALAAEVDVLHIAAHGRHAAENPQFSGFELDDGTLFGYDVDLIPRVPQTVILSACELGRSSVRWGEEAVGMTRVWLHAGSRCVIAAPVAVADDAAGELLSAVHTALSDGAAPAVALAAASVSTGVITPFQCHGNGF